MSDIGARFVACKGWRWMPGMRAVRAVDNLDPMRLQYGSEDTLLIWAKDFTRESTVGAAVDWPGAYVPDTTDPATLGCILALVREAWGNPTIRTQASGPFWIVVAGAGWSGDDLTGEQDGEAAALLAALEAAP